MYYSFLNVDLHPPAGDSRYAGTFPPAVLEQAFWGSYDLRDRELYPKKTKISAMCEDASLVSVKEKIHSFEKKHGCNLKAFEDRIKQLPEDFERWDDLIEWKAYADSLRELESRITD